MPSSKEPVEIVDVPESVLQASATDNRIVVNLRPNYWPSEWLEKIKADGIWRINCQLHNGYFIAPSMTDFMNKINGGEPLAILCQDDGGRIFMVKTNNNGVLWVDLRGGTGCRSYGILGQIKTEEGKGRFSWHVWASYILAIVELSERVKPSCTPDPTGEKFLKVEQRFGKSPTPTV